MHHKLINSIEKFYKLAYIEDEELYEFLLEILALVDDEDIKYFGKKIFLASLFDVVNKYRAAEDRISWEQFSENMIKLHLDNKISMARADLVTAMDSDLVDRSEIQYENATFHFLDLI